MSPPTETPDVRPKPLLTEVSVYHWLVVILASSGWLFDCLGQRVFVLSREPAMKELLGGGASAAQVRFWGSLATSLLMAGWATGGILFGVFSDRYGRVKAMVTTLLAYTLFSGVSGFARNAPEFLFYRFLFGLGVGGMFGAATTLVAESVPSGFRTAALGTMQSLSAFGTMLASAISLVIPPGRENFWGHFSGWQVLCFAGVLPAILAAPMTAFLREPEPWKKAKAQAAYAGRGKSVGSLRDLFGHPCWRHNLLVGVSLGLAGMVGLWGIAFYSPELLTSVFKTRPIGVREIQNAAELCRGLKDSGNSTVQSLKEKLTPQTTALISQHESGKAVPAATLAAVVDDLNRIIQQENLYEPNTYKAVELKKATRNLVERVQKHGERPDIVFLNRQLVEQLFPGTIRELSGTIDTLRSRGTVLQDTGAVLGMFTFTFVAARFSRRAAFLGAFVLGLGVVSFVFYSLKTEADVYWMLPMVGFATLAPFAGYSIYFPELFPTRLRGTGVGFCYNTVRYLTAPFPFLLGWLSTALPFRMVAVMMCGIYMVGIVALLWAPETKGKPLPEET
jgi:MFS family permease